MLSFRFTILIIFSILCVEIQAQTTTDLENDTSLSADILIATLYAKTDAEKDYCQNIIRLRDEKVLPNRILYGAYRKAVTKEKVRRFSYFQTALEILCNREGIDLTQTNSSAKRIFSISSTKPAISAPTNPQTSTSTSSKPFSFFYKIFQR